MGASVSYHARWSSVWSRSEYNVMQHDVEGVYNVVFVVTLIVYIGENCTLHSLIYMWL